MDGDGLSPCGHLEADLIGELGGNAVAAPPLDLLDVEFGEDGGHPERLTTSAGEWPAFRSLGDGRLLVPAELGH